ncbi:MAG: PASTA domain-containing protein [Clostridiales bacterium]|nr:PASTA domain-containing protein [Clostridiales bacterium]
MSGKGLFSALSYKPHSEKWSKLMPMAVFGMALIFAFYEICQLYITTVLNYDEFAKAASRQQWKLLKYTSDRGQIYDANGIALASNSYDYTVVCTPKMVTSKILDRQSIINGFVNILGVTAEKMDSIIPADPNDGSDPRVKVLGCDIMKNVTAEKKDELAAFLDEYRIGGVSFVAVPQRYYNYGSLASQVIGYAKNDGISVKGLYGLEAYYNSTLSGNNGYRYSEVDEATGGVLPYSDATSEPAVDGRNLVLNIDVSIQRITEEACRNAYMKYRPRDGICAIVMNPYTGAVYSMVSLPDFDLNDPYAMPYGMNEEEWGEMEYDDQIQYIMGNCWRNRCVSDTYEPGSTFKALTTCMALEENLTNEDEQMSDAPIAVTTTHTISCWLQKSKHYNHGTETLFRAFQNSCNPIFTQLAQRIGISKYYKYVRMLGFYNTTGIDLPAEGKGIFHSDPQFVDLAVLSYGESSTVTPIQLIMSYCAIINGGDLLVPHIVKYITDSEGNIVDEIEPEVVRTVFSEMTCARVRKMLEAVVTDGTGTAGQVPGYQVAGKTSTSTIETGELRGAHVLSFSCYAPADNPQIAVLVVLNKPENNSVGSSAAASTAADIVSGTLTYMGIPRVFTGDEYTKLLKKYYVQYVIGKTASDAASGISINGQTPIFGIEDMDPETIIGMTHPDYSHTLYNTGVVVLYPDGVTQDQMLTTRVPNLVGMSAIECIEACRQLNLNCNVEGDVTGVCITQNVNAGSKVLAGDIITVTLDASVQAANVTPAPGQTGDDGDASAGGDTGEDGIVRTQETQQEEAGEGENN